MSVDNVVRSTTTTTSTSVSSKDTSADSRWTQAQYTRASQGTTVFYVENKNGANTTVTVSGIASSPASAKACRSGSGLGGMQCTDWK